MYLPGTLSLGATREEPRLAVQGAGEPMLAETAPRGRWRAAPGSQPCPSPLPWSRVSLGTAALVALAQIPRPLGFPGPRAHAFPGFPGLSALTGSLQTRSALTCSRGQEVRRGELRKQQIPRISTPCPGGVLSRNPLRSSQMLQRRGPLCFPGHLHYPAVWGSPQVW